MTIEEIEQAIAAKPELLMGVIGLASKNGYVVRSQDEEKSFIETYEKNVLPQKVSANIGEQIKEMATRYEQELTEITGLNKEQNEKYYDFQKRVFRSLNEKGADKGSLDQLELYKQKVSELTQALTQKDESSKNEILSVKNQYLLDTALANLNVAIPAHLTTDEEKASYKKTFETMVKNDFMNKYKPTDVNGTLAYYEGEQLMFDTKTAQHLSPSDIIKKSYGAFIAPEQQPQKGMGISEPTPKPNVGKMTREEYYSYADSKGIVTGSAEWVKGASEMISQ